MSRIQRRTVLRTVGAVIPSVLSVGCLGMKNKELPAGSLVVENKNNEEHKITVTAVDSTTGERVKRRKFHIESGGKKVVKNFLPEKISYRIIASTSMGERKFLTEPRDDGRVIRVIIEKNGGLTYRIDF